MLRAARFASTAHRCRRCWRGACLVAVIVICGCSTIASRLGSELTAGIRQHDDPATVAAALPAYLLLLDGLIEGDGESSSLLSNAAELYGFYAGSLVAEPERAARLSERALGYARRAVCLELPELCPLIDGPVDAFQAAVQRASRRQISLIYRFGAVWAGHIQTHSEDWVAIAALPKAQSLLERVVEVDPGLEKGLPWVYLGVLHALRPAAVGGNPQRSKAAFEQAIALSHGRNLMAKTLYAERYARLMFERDLHDRMLGEVVAADPEAPGLTLVNVLAQQRARSLLSTGDAYF